MNVNAYKKIDGLIEKLEQVCLTAENVANDLKQAMTRTFIRLPEFILWENKIGGRNYEN